MSQDSTPFVEHTSFSTALVESKHESAAFSEAFYAQQEQSLKQQISQLIAHPVPERVLIPLAKAQRRLADLYCSVGKKEEGDRYKQNAEETFSLAKAVRIVPALSQQQAISARIRKVPISEQERKKLEMTMQKVSALITSYETSPRYASYLADWKALREFWIKGYERSKEPIMQNNTFCRMVRVFLHLAEKYLSQPEDQLPVERQLAEYCSDHAGVYMQRILRNGIASRTSNLASAYLFIPLFLEEEAIHIRTKVKTMLNNQPLLEEKAVLENFQRQWSEMLAAQKPFKEKRPHLSMLIYLSGRLR